MIAPQNTPEANSLWYQINNYFFTADDPNFSKLKSFAKRIMSIRDLEDRKVLIKYFKQEAQQSIHYFLLSN